RGRRARVKYLVFALACGLGVPALGAFACASARVRRLALCLLAASTAFGTFAKLNFVSMEHYRGPDRGFEVTLTDLLALGLVAPVLAGRCGRIRWLPPNSAPFAAY